RCKRWSSDVAELQLSGDSSNPQVRLELSAIDLDGIVRNAQHHDNDANRRKHALELVREELGLTIDENELRHTWRGVQRPCVLDFRNVAALGMASLRHDDEGWKVHIDLPFDQRADGMDADRRVLNEFRQTQEPTRTIVW